PLGARNRAADHQQATLDVGLDDDEVLRGDALVTHMARHLLSFEHLARVLALTSRTVRAVHNRNTVRCAQAAEVPALHGALEALALRGAGDVHELAGDEMVGRDFSSNLDEVLRADTKLG